MNSQEELDCAKLWRLREAGLRDLSDRYWCHCDHAHAPEVSCRRHGGPDWHPVLAVAEEET